MKIDMNFNNQQNFKSSIPTKYWLLETNAKRPYVVSDLTIIKNLQGKIIRALNKNVNSYKLTEKDAFIKKFISKYDINYRINPKTRSVYNHTQDGFSRETTPLSYILTGDDATFADINAKKSCKNNIKESKKEFCVQMLEYASKKALLFKDKNNNNYILNFLFEIVRNTKGIIKDFKFSKMVFTKIDLNR